MAYFDESESVTYDWDDGGVYVLEREDPVEGGADGVSNRQGKELALRTRNLHDRLDKLGEDVDVKDEAVLRSAKEYTDGKETAILSQVDLKDEANLNTAKEYADRIVAALVNGSTEQLDTLKELADALGNDPNFSATVMQKIGEKVSTETLNNQLSNFLRNNGQHCDISQTKHGMGFQYDTGGSGTTGPFISAGTWGYFLQLVCGYCEGSGGYNNLKFRTYNGDGSKWNKWYTVYCDGNLFPATQTTTGLMSAADKKKLDGLGSDNLGLSLVGWVEVDQYGAIIRKGGNISKVSKASTEGRYVVYHYLGHGNYIVQATAQTRGSATIKGFAHISDKNKDTFLVHTADDAQPNDLGFVLQIYTFS